MKKTAIAGFIFFFMLSFIFIGAACAPDPDGRILGMAIIFLFVWGVLYVLFLLKFWGMMDDVAAIREKINPRTKTKDGEDTACKVIFGFDETFRKGEKVMCKPLNKTGIVNGFYDDLYEVVVGNNIYTFSANDLEKL
jgi:hypothetical protein